MDSLVFFGNGIPHDIPLAEILCCKGLDDSWRFHKQRLRGKKAVFKNFTKFLGKHPWGLF